MPPPVKRRKFDPSSVLHTEPSTSIPTNDRSNDQLMTTTQPLPQGAGTTNLSASTSAVKKSAFNSGFNRNILYEYLLHPENYEKEIIFQNDKCTVLYDAFPKGVIHLLLLPNQSYLPHVKCIRDIEVAHLEKVQDLHQIARELIQEIESPSDMVSSSTTLRLPQKHRENLQHALPSSSKLLMGYHVIPSLFPLHLHIISDDFVSSWMRTKKHWNSFATEYFVLAKSIDDWLQAGLSVHTALPSEEIVKSYSSLPLKCHKCSCTCNSMPQLKTHVEGHLILNEATNLISV